MDYEIELWKMLESFEQKRQYEELNSMIDNPESLDKFSEFTLQKLKKRKLLLNDKIRIYRAGLFANTVA